MTFFLLQCIRLSLLYKQSSLCVFVSVLLQSAVTCGYTLSVPVRVNIPLLATSGLKAPILSELLEAFTELDKRGKAAALPD